MHLTNFIFTRTFFLIPSYQIEKTIFRKKNLHKFTIPNNFPEKMIRDLLQSHDFFKFGMKR